MLITTLTRMWLTRSPKPFVFTNKNDRALKYENTESLGIYVHIPFCRQICSFCPYCKELYNAEKLDRYIDYLIREIRLVTRGQTRKKTVTSVYFGGGTPALAADRIGEIITELKRHFIITEGIGVELHPDNVRRNTLLKLKNAGVTKISIGIQSFGEKFSKILGRKPPDIAAISEALKCVKFETVSMDFIFALPGQTFDDLRRDIDIAFENGANHIAVYPFIDFTFTESKVAPMNNRDKRRLLDDITDYCAKKHYRRDSIWTFSNDKSAKYSSMTRDNFLGFGCSATTLLKDQFKINTFSVDEYIKRIKSGRLPTALTIKFTERQRMIYYLFWTAYSTKVSSAAFGKFFGKQLEKEFGFELALARKLGFIFKKKSGIYKMTKKGAFYYHYYENYYTLAYIDKMWSVMRNAAFPKRLVL